ncbi:MAG: hypothetical protein ABI839_06770 [Verrucomicrobiota bacterium]
MKRFPIIALAALLFAGLPVTTSHAQVGISVNFAPPILPVFQQPYCPYPGYIWTPGYWAYGPFGYYWVAGAWVQPPRIGLLWTPPYWGWSNGGSYVFNDGYWGSNVGFYGGINYGYGYFGNGYYGGRWDGNIFRYNTAVSRVNRARINNVYVDRRVLAKQQRNRASFNGPKGVQAQATAAQRTAAENRIPATAKQRARREAASKDRGLQASVNKGHPKASAIDASRDGDESANAKVKTAGEGRDAAEKHRDAVKKNERTGSGRNEAEARDEKRSSKNEREAAQRNQERNENNARKQRSAAAERESAAREGRNPSQASHRKNADAARQRPPSKEKRGENDDQRQKRKARKDDGQH